MLTIALISASLFLPLALADCSTEPIYLDIHQRRVEGANDLSYGAYVNVGTPTQALSLWPSLDLNEITLADDGYCTSSSCSASKAHGVFDPSKSGSFRSTSVTQLDNSSVLTGPDSKVAETGTDVLHLLQHFNPADTPTQTNISSFPFQLLSNDTSTQDPFFGPAGLVGLGPSSTVLNSLYKAGNISSRSYGLYLGSAYLSSGSSSGSNGSLTLGGYDAARFQKPVQSFQLTEDANAISALQVHVSGMTISHGDLTTADLLNSSTFDAYISTSQYELTLPAALAGILPSLQSTTSSDNLTITLSTNFTLSFPPAWLATNPINFTTSPTGPYILGAAFLSTTYLSVSYDSSPPSFFLAPAIPSPAFIAPKPLCPNTPPTPQTTVRLSFFVKNGLAGLIIGATIGGSALCVLAFAVCRGGWRRRRRERAQVLRFVNLKRQEAGEGEGEGQDVELGDWKGGDANEKVLKMQTGQVHVVESMERDAARRGTGAWGAHAHAHAEGEAPMYFDPPPRRATVVPPVDEKSRRERKKGLKGILKVKVPQ